MTHFMCESDFVRGELDDQLPRDMRLGRKLNIYERRGCRDRIVYEFRVLRREGEPKAPLGGRDNWDALAKVFFGKTVGEPYKGVVRDYRNFLGKELPEDSSLDLDYVIRSTKE